LARQEEAMNFIDVWINCPDRKTAEKIAEACIGEKLAACANIFAPITSIYSWQGAVERAEEVPLLLKSRRELFLALSELVRSLHPYDVPSIVATDIVLSDPAYAKWLAEETRI
jgi:periplasmic divalent cation tolerance protein